MKLVKNRCQSVLEKIGILSFIYLFNFFWPFQEFFEQEAVDETSNFVESVHENDTLETKVRHEIQCTFILLYCLELKPGEACKLLINSFVAEFFHKTFNAV